MDLEMSIEFIQLEFIQYKDYQHTKSTNKELHFCRPEDSYCWEALEGFNERIEDKVRI